MNSTYSLNEYFHLRFPKLLTLFGLSLTWFLTRLRVLYQYYRLVKQSKFYPNFTKMFLFVKVTYSSLKYLLLFRTN